MFKHLENQHVSRMAFFFLGNAAAAALLYFFVLQGWLQELWRLDDTERLMENRLVIKEENLANYQENSKSLLLSTKMLAETAKTVLSYEHTAEALVELNELALQYNLQETAFETQEPVTYETETTRKVMAVNAYAVFEGEYGAILDFVRDVDAAGFHIERMTLEASSDNAAVRLNFSVYVWALGNE